MNKGITFSKDHLSKAQRSLNMAKIKQKDTKPEILVRSFLHKKGLRFRKNVKELPGKPDIYFPKYNTVVLVQGCYWHRHSCPRGQSAPTKNRPFWLEKFKKNIERDSINCSKLEDDGFKVIEVWTCKLKPSLYESYLDSIYDEIVNS